MFKKVIEKSFLLKWYNIRESNNSKTVYITTYYLLGIKFFRYKIIEILK